MLCDLEFFSLFRIQYRGIMIPFDEHAVQFFEGVQHFFGLRSKSDCIAETNDLIDVLRFNIRKDRLESGEISVNV